MRQANRTVLGFVAILVFLYLLFEDNQQELDCQEVEFVNVTHREGFYFCHSDSTVWNPIREEWEQASMIDIRRVYGGSK